MSKPARSDEIEDAARHAEVISLLTQVLKELKARKRRAAKRRGTVAERSADLAEREPAKYQPTELQRARARRALGLR